MSIWNRCATIPVFRDCFAADRISIPSTTPVQLGENCCATADAFNYAYTSLSGDGSIVARVASVQNGTETVPMSTNLFIGLAVTSDSTSPATAGIDGVFIQ